MGETGWSSRGHREPILAPVTAALPVSRRPWTRVRCSMVTPYPTRGGRAKFVLRNGEDRAGCKRRRHRLQRRGAAARGGPLGARPDACAASRSIIVDDRSTDGSFEVARRARGRAPRPRAGHPACRRTAAAAARPATTGIDVARGEYVMFLDSDDTLERDACRNILEAAESTGADLVSGLLRARARRLRDGKEIDWYPWLYRRPAPSESHTETTRICSTTPCRPTSATGATSCSTRTCGSPTGIHYEDLLFSAQAYVGGPAGSRSSPTGSTTGRGPEAPRSSRSATAATRSRNFARPPGDPPADRRDSSRAHGTRRAQARTRTSSSSSTTWCCYLRELPLPGRRIPAGVRRDRPRLPGAIDPRGLRRVRRRSRRICALPARAGRLGQPDARRSTR